MPVSPSMRVNRPALPVIRPWWAPALGGAGLIGSGVALGDLVTDEGPRRTGELALDTALAAHRDTVLTWLARGIDLIAGPVGGPLVILTLALAVGLAQRRIRSAMVFIAVSVIGWISVGLAKVWFARPRPSWSGVPALVLETGRDGFPSGHTALVAAVTAATLVTLAQASRRRLVLVWATGALAVALTAASRLYLGAHYLGDVVAAPMFVAGTTLSLIAVQTRLRRAGEVPGGLVRRRGQSGVDAGATALLSDRAVRNGREPRGAAPG